VDIHGRVIVVSVLQDAEQLPCTQILANLSQISPKQGTQASQRLHYVQGITDTPRAKRNSSAAQPGRSQPRRHEAFLRLARSQRIEALPRQTDTVVITDEALS
jgi:hypothetical protein